ncbi:MAG TPA: LamG domain-containing protein [Puia sp.]|nr:LamG domain-containing protein [Puia sp.]
MYAIFKVNGFYAGTAHGNFILVKDWDLAYGAYILQYSDFTNPYGLPDTSHEEFAGAYGDNPGNAGYDAGATGTNGFVRTGTWYKLAYTYDGMVANLYLNGNLISTGNHYKVPFTANSNDLFIGRSSDPSGIFPFWFNGVIDEIRIYDRALTAKEIGALTNLP